ncbi:MAG TPA: adenylate/guanylate cyclase domain-containing protein [Gaiellaceae bacterium]|nr:adenylate/guanylate cyclase domain-containing protein [Gaiellaceae bacterium]HET8651674.1 adenylate/guanylate cyclase domain-containing protein [Gaiellaceae bacterium]
MAVRERTSGVRTFLIADIRGYSRYTEECGDEAAAALSAKFARIVDEDVEAHDGELVETRGDEALVVFASARQAIRAAVDLQAAFQEVAEELDVPLRVGIGIDSGEAVQLEDGTFRGAALNVAARLCGRASGGEVIISESTSRLAGRLGGLIYTDGGRVRLKNIPDPVHVYKVYSELDARPANRWTVMFFGRERRGLSWRVALLVTLIAAATAVGVVYLTAGEGAETTGAAPKLPGQAEVRATGLASIVPPAIWKDCHVQAVPNPRAVETAACVPPNGVPDRWEISRYTSGRTLGAAYRSEFGKRADIQANKGKCNAFVWGGERQWQHGPNKPGGREFCYFDGNDAVIVWSHERLGQPTHRDILVIAREGGSDHAGLTRWWRPWHHLIGKAG